MRSFSAINPLRSYLSSFKSQGQSIGLVPTMGALHDGHKELVQNSLNENECTVVSVFVNKAQFNNPDDYSNYPDQVEKDLQILEALKCDVVFKPTDAIMYPSSTPLRFDFGPLETVMEGEFRPGHFSGVGLVVSKLLNIVTPDRAYFGQKDIQQCAVIKKLVADLNFPVDIRVVPTVRDKNGLALSSRNLLLTEEERIIASDIHGILSAARDMLLDKTNSISETKEVVIQRFKDHKDLNLEYFEVVSSQTLLPIKIIEEGEQTSLCIAAFIGNVRLIDNIYLFD
ncbi:MAG: pantoate--beta-alanine ligase [Cyclobacteriaceae bacterium]